MWKILVCLKCIFCLNSTKAFSLGIRVILNFRLIRIICIFIVVVLSKVQLFFLMHFRHVGEQLFNILFTRLGSQNVKVKFVGLQFNDDFGDCTLKVQPRHQLPIIFLGKLFFAKFDANNWLQLVLDFGVCEHDVAVNHAELHPVELLNAKGFGLDRLVESVNLIVVSHSIQFFNLHVLS